MWRFGLGYSNLMAYIMIWQRKKKVAVGGNREYYDETESKTKERKV